MEKRATSPSSSSRRRFLTLAGLVSLTGCASSAESGETTRASGDVDSGNQTTVPEQSTTQEPPVVEDDYVHPEPTANPSWTVPTNAPSSAVEYEVLVENLEVPWILRLQTLKNCLSRNELGASSDSMLVGSPKSHSLKTLLTPVRLSRVPTRLSGG